MSKKVCEMNATNGTLELLRNDELRFDSFGLEANFYDTF